MEKSKSYNFQLKNFATRISNSWKNIDEEDDFHDVTLACDDNQIKAHKVILSASSPVFKKLLKNNPHQHPLIYLRGVKYRDLANIKDFIYQGEVSVDEESLEDFLSVGHDLKIQGLTEDERQESIAVTQVEQDFFDKKYKSKVAKTSQKNKFVKIEKEFYSKNDDTESKANSTSGMMTNEEMVIFDEIEKLDSGNVYKTKLESVVSVEVSSFSCQICPKQFLQSGNLNRHIMDIHNGVRYNCEQCDYSNKRKDSLKTHVDSVHEGIRYLCHQCDFKALWKSGLSSHIKKKHTIPISDISVDSSHF